MLKIKNSYLILSAFITSMLLFSSCDKIISMLKDEFNSERTPAIPKQVAPASIYLEQSNTPKES